MKHSKGDTKEIIVNDEAVKVTKIFGNHSKIDTKTVWNQ